MKYGLLTGFLRPFANYGDFIQSLAIEHLYKQIGIPQSSIYHITMDELGDYDGEELILPINSFYSVLIDLETGKPRISSKITPVLLSITLADNTFGRSGGKLLTQETLDLFQKQEPIGCRDYYTLKLLEEYGIQVYLQGCLTNALPIRKKRHAETVFLVDCPGEVLQYIPDVILRDAKVSQNSFCVKDLTNEEAWETTKAHYSTFADCARLVVSSRYHVVSPCCAMGIPAIFIKRLYDIQEEDIRLDTINPNVNLYTWHDYSKINWAPEYVPYEAEKESILKLAAARLINGIVDSGAEQAVKSFYRQRIADYPQIAKRGGSFYRKKLQDFVRAEYPYPRSGEFYIWGAKPVFYIRGKISIVDYIQEINPNLVFKGWIDTYKSGCFAGMPIIHPDRLNLSKDQFVVVAAEAAVTDARRRFKALGLCEHRSVICVEEHITEEDLMRTRQERRDSKGQKVDGKNPS